MPLNRKNINDTLGKYRLRIADKIIRFCLDKRIRNVPLTKFLFEVHQRLIKGVYFIEHKESNHHYIPQFLLRNFSIENNSAHVYRYTHFSIAKTVSIEKEAALVKNLYTSTDKETKKKSDYLENQIFAKVLEKYASRIINLILKTNKLDLTPLEESILASFVGFQYVRTPSFLESIKHILTYLSLSQKIPTEEMVKDDFFIRCFIKNEYKIKPREVASFLLKNKKQMVGAENLLLLIAIRIGNLISKNINSLEPLLLTTKGEEYFFISDSGTQIYNINYDRSVGPFLWEFDSKSIIFLPLSPKICLYYTIKPLINFELLSIPLIRGIMIDNTRQYIYSDRKDDSLETDLHSNL